MCQLEQVYTASPEQPLLEILEMMNDQNINQVPIVQDGRFVGVLSRESVLRYLQIRQSLSTEKPRYAA
jgi:CBS domain-containing protein